jgi:putative ATP-binding cassette transporter
MQLSREGHAERPVEKSIMRGLLRLLFQFGGPSPILGALLAIGAGVANAATLMVVNSAVNGSTAPSGRIIGLFALLCLASLLASSGSQLIHARLVQGTISRVRATLCRKILDSSLTSIEKAGPSNLLIALTDDVGTITNAAAMLPAAFTSIAVVLASLGYMAWLSLRGFLFIAVLTVIGFAAFSALRAPSYRFGTAARRDKEDIFRHLRSLIEGFKELKIHRARREALLSGELAKAAASFRRHNVLVSVFAQSSSSFGLMLFLISIGVFVFAPLGEPKTVVWGYVITILYLQGAIEFLVNQSYEWQRATIAHDRLNSLGISLGAESLSAEVPADAPTQPAQWRRLEMTSVMHRYKREGETTDFRVGPLSLSLTPGEVVFLVGGNGSGKSTLAKMLVGLYSPERGKIALDDVVIDDNNRDWYRQHFSVIFADYFLFDSLLGLHPDTTKLADLLEALKLSGKVTITDGVFSTTNLSSGQRKRLALVCSFLEDRPIYVFDEWTSDQDPAFKRYFYTQILPDLRRRNKAVVVISHDDRYFSAGDRLIKLEDGRQVTMATAQFMAKIL